MGSGHACAFALLAGNPAGQSGRAGASGEGHRHRPKLRASAGGARDELHVDCPYGWADTSKATESAESAAKAAIRADGDDPWAHNALTYAYLFAHRFDDSLAECELALRLNPNFALAQGYYGLSLCYSGRWEESDLAARRALRLSPRDPFSAVYYGIAAYAQFLGRNYDEAMRLAGEGIRQRDDF